MATALLIWVAFRVLLPSCLIPLLSYLSLRVRGKIGGIILMDDTCKTASLKDLKVRKM